MLCMRTLEEHNAVGAHLASRHLLGNIRQYIMQQNSRPLMHTLGT